MKRLRLDDTLPYCVLHGWQDAPEAPAGDLDMAIAPQHLAQLEHALHAQPEGRLVQLLQHETSGFYFVLAFETAQSLDFLPVDAATDYRRDGRVFFSAETLLHERRQGDAWWVASPAVEFGYLLVKKVLKGEITAHQKPRLQTLAQTLGAHGTTVARQCFGTSLGDAVLGWIVAADWPTLEATLPRLRRALLWHTLWRDPLTLARYWGPEARRIWRRWRYPTGLWVAVLGPDGAGKSALLARLRTDLAEAFRRSVTYHLQPDMLGRHPDHGPVPTPHAQAPHGWGASLLKLLYYGVDYRLGYLGQIRQHLVRSTLVLFDRYYDDLLVDSRRYRYAGPAWPARALQRLIPRPDLFFVLDAPAAVIRQRKQELPEPELHRQRHAYQRLAASLPHAYVLDATAPAAEVARQARALVLDCLHARYLQRRPLWFGSATPRLAPYQAALAPFVQLQDAPESTAPETPACLFGLLPLRNGRGYLLPLHTRTAAATALTLYSPQTWRARLGRRLLQAGLRLGLAQPFLRRVWLPVRTRPSRQGPAQIAVLGYVQQLLGQGPLTFGVSLGTPGPHRKPVMQILDAQGRVQAYAKIGCDAVSNALVQHEAARLRALAPTTWQRLCLPEVLSASWFQDAFLCVLSPLPHPGRRVPARLTPLHLAALHELAAWQTVHMPLSASAWWQGLQAQTERVAHPYYRHVLEHYCARVAAWLADMPLPFGLAHGDFTPWNLRRHGITLGLVDWECAIDLAPPLWDALHFTFQTAYLVKRCNAARLATALSETAAFTALLHRRGLPADALTPLALLYSLDRLAFWAQTAPADQPLLRTLSTLVTVLGSAL